MLLEKLSGDHLGEELYIMDIPDLEGDSDSSP